MKTIIVLSGIPTSGKTTIGRLLEQKGYFYVPEIVEQFIKQGMTTGVDANSILDEMIMEAELQRDKRLFSLKKNPLIIETWHPGNIAYACLRNPSIAEQYRQIFGKIAKYNKIYGIYLNIPFGTFWKRTGKYKKEDCQRIVAFFKRWQNEIVNCYEEFRVPLRKIDSNRPENAVLSDVIKSVKVFCKN